MSQLVGIIDYGAGNIHSVGNAIVKLGGEAVLISDPEDVASFDKIILPGVGAFSHAMDNLNQSGMATALDAHVKSGKPLMGICLGMQLMCTSSLEDGEHAGFGWIDANVIPFDMKDGLKIPHMGWNAIHSVKESPYLTGFIDDSDVYFVHSYYVVCNNSEDALLTCHYGSDFVAGFSKANIIGLQFHPEKSQSTGLMLLENFLDLK